MNSDIRKMLMVSAALGQNISELWEVYQGLFSELDLDDEHTYSVMCDLLAEMERNLIDVLDQVGGQIYVLTGVYEPLPVDTVEDFEGSVLTTLAGLDSVDLEEYRVPDYDEDDEDE